MWKLPALLFMASIFVAAFTSRPYANNKKYNIISTLVCGSLFLWFVFSLGWKIGLFILALILFGLLFMWFMDQ